MKAATCAISAAKLVLSPSSRTPRPASRPRGRGRPASNTVVVTQRATQFIRIGPPSGKFRAVNVEHVTHVDDQEGKLMLHLINGERVVVSDVGEQYEVRRVLGGLLVNPTDRTSL